MKPIQQIHDPYHNPFHNRFHIPVHSRLDEMQTLTHMAWLKESPVFDHGKDGNARPWGPTLAAVLALMLFVIFSATILSH